MTLISIKIILLIIISLALTTFSRGQTTIETTFLLIIFLLISCMLNAQSDLKAIEQEFYKNWEREACLDTGIASTPMDRTRKDFSVSKMRR